MLAQGVTLGEIQKVLGHTTIAMTATRDAHASPGLIRNAATAMDRIFAAG
jgi:integrase